ncbi:MAG: hypothetical protein Q8M02_10585 [Candidatus Didemnitutus sp.]|nr:hypothetical protein [Candidatus Didemnitutus sp.]
MTNPINSDSVRQALLAGAVAKLARGGAAKLTTEERKVLATVSPEFADPAPATVADTEPADPPTGGAPAPAGAPPVVVRKFAGGRLKFAHGYEHYAEQLGVSLRTIKRWVRTGKEKSDLCPLDDLAQLHGWWTRCQNYDAPTQVVAASAEAARANAEAPPTPSTGEQVAGTPGTANAEGKGAHGATTPPPPGKPLIAHGAMESITLEDTLARVSRQHRANLDLLDEAYTGTNEAALTARLRNARASGEMLAAAQRALDEYRAARGDMVPIADVQDEGRRVHTAMAQSLLNAVVELGVHRARAATAINDWFLQLRESDFFAATIPTLTPAPPPSAATTPVDAVTATATAPANAESP